MIPAATDAAQQPTSWTLPNGDRSSARIAAGSLTPATVGKLRVRWRLSLVGAGIVSPDKAPEAKRGAVATPIVFGSTVYLQDSTSEVWAINRSTGAVRWRHPFHAPNYGRNGLSYSSGSLYGSTDTTAFALSAKTGRLLWQRFLITPTAQFIDIAPLVANDLVYISTVGYPPGGRGVLYALDAHSGKVRWRFGTIAAPWRDPKTAGGGGAWYAPSVDARGNLYWGTSNPYPLGGTRALPNGGAFAGAALYTDSLLYLNGRTGKLLWHDQVTTHDVRDYDFQLPPILGSLPAAAGPAQSVVFGGGKAGQVIAWDAATHRRLWETAVGKHLNDTGPLPTHTVTVCPGFFGGIESPMAYDLAREALFVPIVDLCVRGSATGYTPVDTLDPAKGTGEMVSLAADTGAVLWRRTFPQPDFGCATLTNGVVFTSTIDGTIYGLDEADGSTLWTARAPAGINGCPTVSGGLLLVAAGSGSNARKHTSYALVAYGLPRDR